MNFRTLKMSHQPGSSSQDLVLEELRHEFPNPGQLEVLDAWAQASSVEKTRWAQAAERHLGVSVEGEDLDRLGAMYTLVEDLIRDRAFAGSSGVYLNPEAGVNELSYAAQRLGSSGMKTVYLDWDRRPGADELEVEVLKAAGVEVVELGGGESHTDEAWLRSMKRAGQLMLDLEDVDVLVFHAGAEAVSSEELTLESMAMSAGVVGRLAAGWEASILVGGDAREPGAAALWAKVLKVLVAELEMGALG